MAVDLSGTSIGRYRLVRALGSGRYGTVYLAHDSARDNTAVALRLLSASAAPESPAEFAAVARLLTAFDHPHLAPVLDAIVDGATPALVMLLAPHGNLRDVYARGRQIPLEQFLLYVRECASALDYLHAHGLLHLDVKPEHMVLGPYAEIRLSGAGLALLPQPPTYAATLGLYAGTPLFSAPEQIVGDPGPASDQYALATCVYLWLTGTFPWEGDLPSLAARKRSSPPRAIRDRVPYSPQQVDDVVRRALAPMPADRFPTVTAFADALAEASQPSTTLLVPGTTLFRHDEHSSTFTLEWCPSGRQIASISLECVVDVWDATTGRTICRLDRNASRAVWAPDGRRIAVDRWDGGVQIWNAATGQALLTYLGHVHDNRPSRMMSVAWSPDGRMLVSCAYGAVLHVWDAVTGERVMTLTGGRESGLLFGRAGWSPDGTRIAAGGTRKTEQDWEGCIYVWDAATGELVRDWRCHTFGLSALKWAPDGNLLVSSGASGAGFEIQIWDAATGESVLLYSGHHALVGALAWSPDGTRIVSANRSTAGWILYRQPDPPEAIETMVQVWDSRTGRLLLNYRGHYTGFPISVDAVAWSPDGERIASSSLSTLVWVAPAAPGSGDA